MKDSHAQDVSGHEEVEAEHLLRALSAIEVQAESLEEKLGPFDKPGAMLPAHELSNLREGLKRIATRAGVWTALAERIAAAPESKPETPAEDGSVAKTVVTPEDQMFPLAGFSDGLTGLPSRLIAEKAIESAIEVGHPRFAAVFALDRIGHMSNRYGPEVGNQALRHCAQSLSQRLPPDALVFRWRGAAFVILFESSGAASDAKLLEQISSHKLKFDFLTSHGSAMVNLTVSQMTIPFAAHSRAVYQQIDQFIEGHSARQPR